MSPVRTGAVRSAAALLALALLGTGCSKVAEVKTEADKAANTNEVCAKTSPMIRDTFSKVADESKQVDATKLAQFKAAIGAEFTTLHKGLQEQIAKVKDLKVKDALQALDTEVAGWATNPEAFIKVDQKKLTTIAERIDTVCHAK